MQTFNYGAREDPRTHAEAYHYSLLVDLSQNIYTYRLFTTRLILYIIAHATSNKCSLPLCIFPAAVSHLPDLAGILSSYN